MLYYLIKPRCVMTQFARLVIIRVGEGCVDICYVFQPTFASEAVQNKVKIRSGINVDLQTRVAGTDGTHETLRE